jgi:hypothetical protein
MSCPRHISPVGEVVENSQSFNCCHMAGGEEANWFSLTTWNHITTDGDRPSESAIWDFVVSDYENYSLSKRGSVQTGGNLPTSREEPTIFVY